MVAVFRIQKLSLAQYVQHTGADFSASHSLCNICNYHWLTTWHAQHFEICVCPLDAIFMTFWSSNLQVGGIRDILKLSSADCTTWHGVCSMLRLTSVNCTVFATFRNQHVQIAWDLQLFESNNVYMGKCTQHFGARPSFLPAVLLPSFLPSFFPFLLSGLCPSFYSCWFSILIPFSFDKFAWGSRCKCKFAWGSRCKCSMQQACQLLGWGEQPTALVAAWTEGMSAVASVEAS